jgi:tRNA(fMet)-specific endonuclease VapC
MKRRYLLDTCAAQDLQYDRTAIRKHVSSQIAMGHRVGICMPVLGELWSGVEGARDRHDAERLLYIMLGSIFVWPYSSDAAREYGRIFMSLSKVGRPMQQIDIQIAAIARTLGNCTIVTMDSDFKAIPGLTLEDWSI